MDNTSTKTTTSAAVPLIYGRLADILAAVTPIGKGRKNKEQGYQYRGIDDIYNEMHDLFAQARVFVTCAALELHRDTRQTAKGGTMHVVHGRFMIRFTTEDGSFVEFPVGGEAQDSGDKATNKAASAALKYAIMQTFLIPTAEVKDSEADDEPAEATPLAPPRPPVAPPAAARAEPLDLTGAAVPGPTKPPAAPEEVERCLAAIAAAPDPSVPFNALLDLRQVHPVDHKRLTAALRHALLERPAPSAPDPALADRPALPARGKTARGTPKMF